jgi:hypothetical protein
LLLELELLLLELLLLLLLLPLSPPPPQPTATPQSIVHKSVCTFARARWTIRARAPVIRPSTAALAARNTALKGKHCDVRTVEPRQFPSVDAPAPLIPGCLLAASTIYDMLVTSSVMAFAD